MPSNHLSIELVIQPVLPEYTVFSSEFGTAIFAKKVQISAKLLKTVQIFIY